jgi:predicted O-methyltransferase YrrM
MQRGLPHDEEDRLFVQALLGGGRLIGADLEPSKTERARANAAAAGLAELFEFGVGDGRETLKSGEGADIDMVMLDGAVTLYLPILKLLRPGEAARRSPRPRGE